MVSWMQKGSCPWGVLSGARSVRKYKRQLGWGKSCSRVNATDSLGNSAAGMESQRWHKLGLWGWVSLCWLVIGLWLPMGGVWFWERGFSATGGSSHTDVCDQRLTFVAGEEERVLAQMKGLRKLHGIQWCHLLICSDPFDSWSNLSYLGRASPRF